MKNTKTETSNMERATDLVKNKLLIKKPKRNLRFYQNPANSATLIQATGH